MWMSIRSSSGPLIRVRYFSTCIGLQLQCRFGSPRNPHGHGFIAATSITFAGNVTDPIAREIVTH